MQLSRIKRMSEKRKKAWLEAIDELKRDYRNDVQTTSDCPLCGVPEDCGGCLWVIIEGCGCMRYAWGKDYVGVPGRWVKIKYKAWIPHRFKMLKRWRRIIKEN